MDVSECEIKRKLWSFTFTRGFYRGNPWISVDTVSEVFMNFRPVSTISVATFFHFLSPFNSVRRGDARDTNRTP